MILLLAIFVVVFRVQNVKAGGTIYIRADGSIDGPANITTSDYVTYYFTDNNYDSIIVERDNIVVDGAGYTLQGTVYEIGISMTWRSNVTIKNMEIKAFGCGIYLDCSSNSIISGNNITANNYYSIGLDSSSNNSVSGNKLTANNLYGICLYSSSNKNSITGNNITANTDDGIILTSSNNNSISGNNIADNGNGIYLGFSSNNNSISGNNIMNNECGIYIIRTSNNTFYHNNIINNTQQVDFYESDYTNFWDNGVEGNYWSNYTGVDSDHDGIGEAHHKIDASNIDYFPLIGKFSSFNTFLGYKVNVISNSTISDFKLGLQMQLPKLGFNVTSIFFYVTGETGMGFCRICIPRSLLNGTYKVFVNGTEVPYSPLPCSNDTHSYLYFNYTHSTQEVIIIPEFPSLIILPLFMIATLLSALVYRGKKSKMSVVASFYQIDISSASYKNSVLLVEISDFKWESL